MIFNDLLQISSDKDLSGIKRLYDEIEIHVRSLESLGIKGEHYSSLLSPVVMERLPPDFKRNISRELKDDLWDLTKLLGLIKNELKVLENCNLTSTSSKEHSEFVYSGSSLHSRQQNVPNKLACVFCKKPHWSDKCSVITDSVSRKEFLKQGHRCFLCLKQGHKLTECNKKKSCFYLL